MPTGHSVQELPVGVRAPEQAMPSGMHSKLCFCPKADSVAAPFEKAEPAAPRVSPRLPPRSLQLSSLVPAISRA